MGKIDNHPTNSIHHSSPKPLQTQHLHPLYRHSAPESIGWLRDTFAKSSIHKSLRQNFARRFAVKYCRIRTYEKRRTAAGFLPRRLPSDHPTTKKNQTAFANSIAFSKALILSLALAPNQRESRRLSSVRPLL